MLTDRRAALVLLMCSWLQGCGTGYLLQAARGQWQLSSRSEPIERVIADRDTDAKLRERLEFVQDVRAFAVDELGLPDNESYRRYADLERPYVVWNVVATPPFSIEPREWCFPIAGCVAYRGYFSEQDARDYALTLRSRGDDVHVGGVPAYSTLGKLADPVLNTMMGYGDQELASTIFHELAHQVVYVPGDSAFNEAFAVTVEQAGLARWLASQGRAGELARYEATRARRAEAAALFTRYRSMLRALYASDFGEALMRERKRDILAELATELRAFEARHGLRTGYRDWIESGLNNAHVASVATYFACVPGFQRVLEANGGDLPAFYAAVRALGAKPPGARREALCESPPPEGLAAALTPTAATPMATAAVPAANAAVPAANTAATAAE